eukprot:1499461-Alexandrium_andersonii.AAC.1
MSASLVGSEMCIRDRLIALGVRARNMARLDSMAVSLRASSSTLRRTAVSYTHLTLPTICSV